MTTTSLTSLIERRMTGRQVTDTQLRRVAAYEWDHFAAPLTPAGEVTFHELSRRFRGLPPAPARRLARANMDDFNRGWGA
jgi:hypothetical protein